MKGNGLTNFRTVKPADLEKGDATGAKAQLEYALFSADETLADHPEILRAFYTGEIKA